jgi:riboflavin kinase/FMN adenylyltransferase
MANRATGGGVQVWRLQEVPSTFGPCVVASGNFDGVHRGHAMLLTRLMIHSRERGQLPVVLTFDPHPMAVLRRDRAPKLITPMPERVRLLGEAGVEVVVIIPFTPEVAAVPARDFAQYTLVDTLRASVVVVGEDFHFGANATGDVPNLRAMGRLLGFQVDAVAVQSDGVARLSSTRVRELIEEGDVAGAAEILGRPHAVTGTVMTGERRGRELGFPTANLACPPELAVPADGVYAGWLTDGNGPPLPAAISIGTNPTFDENLSRRVEAYVIGRDDLDLYGHEVTVSFVARLRGMDVFDSVEALVAQMTQDVAAAQHALS